ncbi:sodium-independent sulfate anion transporter isoform X4 [Haemorhous mexicanus]|uniref:sodium-independent sulfate anion transporter isoform X4 n=1 Tax=Haemorhous mexicanus TaxID=30427 RepID=UPI0028BE5B36|nr:sodium-independent sulfate anion transporter isoform X4 [Haemorhous mexicanus]
MAVVTGLGWAGPSAALSACTEHPGAAGHPEAVLPAGLRDSEEDWGDQGWGRCAGAELSGSAGRAPGHEEPPAPGCPHRTTGCQDQPPDCVDLCHSTQRSRGPVCWPGGLLLPGDGLPALQAHRQHPPGPASLPAPALLPGSAQRHRPLPERGAASQNGYRIDPNQELLALGVANVLGSFVSSYPITGSFGRTAVNAQSGVCTPAGGLVTGALVLLSLAYLTSVFCYIPKAALAALIISAVVPMFDAGIFWTLWRVKRLDLVPLCVTFLLCFWEVQYGIVAGLLVSGLLLLYSIARPPIRVSEGAVLLVQLGSSLHFPAVEHLRDSVCSRALAGTALLACPGDTAVTSCITLLWVAGVAQTQDCVCQRISSSLCAAGLQPRQQHRLHGRAGAGRAAAGAAQARPLTGLLWPAGPRSPSPPVCRLRRIPAFPQLGGGRAVQGAGGQQGRAPHQHCREHRAHPVRPAWAERPVPPQ